MRKFIITAELRDITDRWDNPNREDSISYSKMVELLNEKALKYAQEYADSKWVSVHKELPSKDGKYICFGDYGITIQVWNSFYNCWNNEDGDDTE